MQPNPWLTICDKIKSSRIAADMDHYVDMAVDVDDTWLPTWRARGCLRGRHMAAYVDNDKDADVDFFSYDMSC
jgi:hypothetical protein